MLVPSASVPRPRHEACPALQNPCDALAPLRERGITQATLDYFGIRPTQCSRRYHTTGRYISFVGALYPIYDSAGRLVGERGKRMGSVGPDKYWWQWNTPDAAHLLYGDRSIIAGEPVILTEGEADCWVMHSLGIPARTTLRGAEAAPSVEVISQLEEDDPSVVFVAYDKDAAGRRGAIAAVRALRDAGLTADALALPSWLPSKADLTDLYAALGYNRDAFITTIRGLDRLPIPAPEAPIESRRYERRTDDSAPWETFNATHDILTVAERRSQVKQVGRLAVMLCPFHGDTSPSLYLYPDDGHFHCYSCGAHGDAYDLNQGRCRRDGQEVWAA